MQCLGTSLIFHHYLVSLCSPATNDLSHSRGQVPGLHLMDAMDFPMNEISGPSPRFPTSRRYLPHQSRPPSSPRRDPRPSAPRCCRHWPWSLVKLAVTWNMGKLVGGFNQPLWKIWVRQLGWRHSKLNGKNKIHASIHQHGEPMVKIGVIGQMARWIFFLFDLRKESGCAD